jgi:hypothetical protein
VSHQYGFHERLEWSRDPATNARIKARLLALLPGALDAHPAHRENDRQGTDWWVEYLCGKHISVDAKIREKDYALLPEPQDDLALEIWSVKEQGIVGWTLEAARQTDYVLWYWKDSERWCWLPFPVLCAAFKANCKAWAEQYGTSMQLTERGSGKGYHSECVFVPRLVVFAAMERIFSGLSTTPPGGDSFLTGLGFDSPDAV